MWVSPAWEPAVSTYDNYASPVAPGTWDVPAELAARRGEVDAAMADGAE
jgi:hypothetical protein